MLKPILFIVGFALPAHALALDCTTVLTSAEVQAVCGKTVSEMKKHFSETGTGINTCVRNAEVKRGEGVFFRVAENASESDAAGFLKHAYKGSSASGLGTAARYNDRSTGFGPSRTLAIQKGKYVLEVKTHWMRKGKPACTKEQLTELARKALARLP